MGDLQLRQESGSSRPGTIGGCNLPWRFRHRHVVSSLACCHFMYHVPLHVVMPCIFPDFRVCRWSVDQKLRRRQGDRQGEHNISFEGLKTDGDNKLAQNMSRVICFFMFICVRSTGPPPPPSTPSKAFSRNGGAHASRNTSRRTCYIESLRLHISPQLIETLSTH